MRRIAATFNGETEVLWVAPEVPEKGDAFDYFTMGGTTDEILALALSSSLTPKVEELEDGYLVIVPDLGGAIYFEFVDVSERAHDLTADATVWQDVPGQSRDRFSTRLNVLSASARDGWRRSLDEMFGGAKGYWTGLVNKATALFREAHRDRDWSVDLHEIETDLSVSYLIHPILPAEGATIWFGMGESGKSYVVLSSLLNMALAGTPVMFVDYEADERAIKRRVVRLAAGLGVELEAEFFRRWFIYWPARGKPFSSMLPAIKRRVEQGIGIIGIDSAAAACGSNPNDEEAALSFFNALSRLRIPSLTVAHVTKADADKYPFGSIFWHNYARATWNVKTPEEREPGEKHLGFYPRKGNEDVPHKPLGMVIEFGEGTTVIKKGTLDGELEQFKSLKNRLRQYILRRGKVTRRELTEALGERDDAVRKALARMPDAMYSGEHGSKDGFWYIVGEDQGS
jgi:hypothetical protein